MRKLSISITILLTIMAVIYGISYFSFGIMKTGKDTYIVINDNKTSEALGNIDVTEVNKFIYVMDIKGFSGKIARYQLVNNKEIKINANQNSKLVFLIPTNDVVIQETAYKTTSNIFVNFLRNINSDSRMIVPWKVSEKDKIANIRYNSETCKIYNKTAVQSFYFKTSKSTEENISFYRNITSSSNEKITSPIAINVK